MKIAITAAVLLTCLSAPVTAQTVLDFNGLQTSPNGGIFNGDPLTENGFRLSTINALGFYGMADGWQNNRGSSNGTTTCYVYSATSAPVTFKLESVAGSAFGIKSIDMAELFNVGDFAYQYGISSVTITGTLSGGGTVVDIVPIDGISDGTGGAVDFETHVFSAAWAGLTSVEFSGTSGSSSTYMNFDNITIDDCTPVVASTYGAGCAGTSGVVPTLDATGCEESSIEMEITNSLTNTSVLLFAGTSQATLPLGGGCDLLLVPTIGPIGPIPLVSATGTLTLTAPYPAVPASLQLYLQAIVIDAGGPLGFSATNGLALTLNP